MENRRAVDLVQVDAFTTHAFGGNPAAVCLLRGSDWPTDGWLQSFAAEMNLSETAFLLRTEEFFSVPQIAFWISNLKN